MAKKNENSSKKFSKTRKDKLRKIEVAKNNLKNKKNRKYFPKKKNLFPKSKKKRIPIRKELRTEKKSRYIPECFEGNNEISEITQENINNNMNNKILNINILNINLNMPEKEFHERLEEIKKSPELMEELKFRISFILMKTCVFLFPQSREKFIKILKKYKKNI